MQLQNITSAHSKIPTADREICAAPVTPVEREDMDMILEPVRSRLAKTFYLFSY